MTYPQQPGFPQPPAPQYPQQPQQFAPPAPPQQYAPPAQGYPAPQYPQPQGYPAPQYQQQWAPPQPEAPAAVAGSLDAFYSQPSSGFGPGWSWTKPPVPMGTTFAGIVARPLTSGDVEHQRAPGANGAPLYFKDGRPQFTMKVPMLVQANAQFPEGKAQWYVKGQARDDLARAMSEVGAPEGPPEAGALIAVQWVSERPNSFGTMSKVVRVTYQRPAGAAPVQAPPVQEAPPLAPPAPQGPAPVQQPPQQFAPPVAQMAPPAPVQQEAPPAPPAPAAAPNMTEAQQQLLASLVGKS